MGWGMDEDWEEDTESELNGEEKEAASKLGYGEDEWLSLDYWEKREKIHLSKFFKKGELT